MKVNGNRSFPVVSKFLSFEIEKAFKSCHRILEEKIAYVKSNNITLFGINMSTQYVFACYKKIIKL